MALQLTELKFLHIETPVASATKGGPKKLVLLVHGRGGQLKLMQWFSKRFKLPGVDYLCLEAPVPEDVPEMKEPGYSWYLMPEWKHLDESREKIKKTLVQLSEQNYSYERMAWLGFSQGGLMGIDTALRFEKKLAGFICVSGFCLRVQDYPEAFGPAALKQKILCTHGVRDEIVPFEKAKQSFETLQKLGVDLSFKEFNKPHSFELKTEIPFLEDTLKSWL